MDRQSRGGVKVLIVDDDYHFNVDVLGFHLRRLGYPVDSAFTIDEFRTKAASADVIVLDIRLPPRAGETVDIWGGLGAYSELLSIADGPMKARLQRVVIRSANAREDAVRAGKLTPALAETPWLAVDSPLTEIVSAVDAAAAKAPGGQRDGN